MRQKTKIKLKNMSADLQDGNIGFFFIFFDKTQDMKEFQKFAKSYKPKC